MASNADGSIIIDTQIQDDGFTAGTKELEVAAKRMVSSLDSASKKTQAALSKQADSFAKLNSQYSLQEKKVDSLKQKLRELESQKISTSAYEALEKELGDLGNEFDTLEAKRDELLNMGFSIDTGGLQNIERELDTVYAQMERVRAMQEQLRASGGAYIDPTSTQQYAAATQKLEVEETKLESTNTRLNSSYTSLKEKVRQYSEETSKASTITQTLKDAGTKLGSIFRSAFSKVVSGAKNAIKNLKKTEKATTNTHTSMLKMLTTMLGFRTVFAAWSAALRGVKEGFQNLAQYSTTTNTSISNIISALTRLKNALATAFNPILTVISPILTKFINLLADAFTYIGMFFAALTGQSTFTKAVGVQEDYAAGLSDTASAASDAADAINDAAEAAEGYLSPIEEVNRLTSNTGGTSSSGGTGSDSGTAISDMFETVAIDSWLSDLASKFKSVLSDIFAPIKQAWNDYGQGVMDAWSYALEEVKGLISDIGSTWLKVWKDGTGYTVTKNILLILQEIGLWIGDIASAWRSAWDKYGETLVRSIFDLLNAILVLIYSISTAFRNVWNSGIGEKVCGIILQILTNIVDTVKNLVTRFTEAWNEGGRGERIATAIFTVIDKILTFVNSIVEATKNWAAQINFGPLLDAIGGFLEKISTVITNIADAVKPFYENVVLPFLTWLIETALPWLIDKLGDVLVWISENSEAVGAFIITFLGLSAVISVITAVGTALSFLAANPVVLAIAAIAALVAIGVLLYQNWDEISAAASEIWGEIKNVFSNFSNWLSGVFQRDWTSAFGALGNILNGFFTTINGLWESIKQVFNGIITFISNVFAGNWSQAWEGIKEIFSGVWNALVTIVKAPINAIIGIINTLLSLVESAQHWLADALSFSISLPGWLESLTGYSSFGISVGKVSIPRIPYLATGAVIPPNSPFMAVLGDQRSGTNIEAPLDTIKQGVRDVLAESGGGNGGSYRFSAQINRRTLFDEFITEAKLRQSVTGRNPLELTT